MSKDNIIDLEQHKREKKQQEQNEWYEILNELEQKTDEYAANHILDPIEKNGHKNLHRFIEKLREITTGEDNDD